MPALSTRSISATVSTTRLNSRRPRCSASSMVLDSRPVTIRPTHRTTYTDPTCRDSTPRDISCTHFPETHLLAVILTVRGKRQRREDCEHAFSGDTIMPDKSTIPRHSSADRPKGYANEDPPDVRTFANVTHSRNVVCPKSKRGLGPWHRLFEIQDLRVAAQS